MAPPPAAPGRAPAAVLVVDPLLLGAPGWGALVTDACMQWVRVCGDLQVGRPGALRVPSVPPAPASLLQACGSLAQVTDAVCAPWRHDHR